MIANDSNNSMAIFPLMLIRVAGLPLHWLSDEATEWPEESEAETAAAEAVQQAFDTALSALSPSSLRTAVYKARRDFFKKRKMPGATFWQHLAESRSDPSLAQLLDNLYFWNDSQHEKTQFSRQYESALHASYRLLQQAARDETLCRALLFASHDLLNRLPAFCEKPVEHFNKKDRQTALSLLQYLSRAAMKTSPLSRFTTVALKNIAETHAAPAFENGADFRSVVSPNVAMLPALYEVLLREPAFFSALSVVLNPCVRRPTERSWLYFDGEQESFQQMDVHPVAGFVIKSLIGSGRKMPFAVLLALLEEAVEAKPEQLQRLVFELIELGLLEWELPEKGLSPGWCGALYSTLAFLPQQTPAVRDAAELLQWLRAAARTLPFRDIGGAQSVQREAQGRWATFFGEYGATMPPLPPEQIFFEDVTTGLRVNVPERDIRTFAEDLAECWQRRDERVLPPFPAQIFTFAEKLIGEGEVIDFLTFSKQFVEYAQHNAPSAENGKQLRVSGLPARKIGALLQIFRDENGRYRAALNGLFPGGGKLFARWAHLFPASVADQLNGWFNTHSPEADGCYPFPWQGWSNANFQPARSAKNLAVPDGRTSGEKQLLLGNLVIKRTGNTIQLIDNESGKPILLNDLGLETPESRPPVMQLLWHLGVPRVSLEALLPGNTWEQGGAGWHFRPRTERGSLILSRKAWLLETSLTEQWLSAGREVDFFRRVRREISDIGVPSRFFARFSQEKPQYFDYNSPLSMQLFAKTLRQKKSPLVLVEMLPLPEHCIVQQDDLRAAEFVLEFELG